MKTFLLHALPLLGLLLLLACDTVAPEVLPNPAAEVFPCTEVEECRYSYTLNGRVESDTFMAVTYSPHWNSEEYPRRGKVSIKILDVVGWSSPSLSYTIAIDLDDFPAIGDVIDIGRVDWDDILQRGGKRRGEDRGIWVDQRVLEYSRANYFPVPSERNEMVVTGYEYDDEGNVVLVSGTFEATLALSWLFSPPSVPPLGDTLRIQNGSFRSLVYTYTPPGWEP